MFDMTASFAGLLILSPFYAVIIVLMELTMPGPVFFKQERVGKDFKHFMILKFRTMRVDKEAEKSFSIEKDSERITPFGKILRRTKLDETPQLINILRGDMSIVGPRPTVPKRIEEFPEGQKIRLSMRPGLTGISQVRGNVLLSYPRRIYYDCLYVKEFNIMLDLKLIFKTIGVIIYGEESFVSAEDLQKYRNPYYDIVKGKKRK